MDYKNPVESKSVKVDIILFVIHVVAFNIHTYQLSVDFFNVCIVCPNDGSYLIDYP